MNPTEQEDLAILLNALADPERIAILGLLSQGESLVRTVAEARQIPAADAFRHIYEMHHVGLLNLRMAGPENYYRTNPNRIAKLQAYMSRIMTAPTVDETPVSDNAWIDELDWPEEDKKVLREYTFDGRLTTVQIKEKKWLVVLRWIVQRFEPGTRYTEKQVNAILTEIHKDYATIRRDLIDFGFMQRERGGAAYWLTSTETPVSS